MYTLKIEQDTCPQDPRSLDYTDCNLGAMICFHRRYSLGDTHNYSNRDFSCWGDLKKQLIKIIEMTLSYLSTCMTTVGRP